MATYRIQMMDDNSFNEYMGGGYNYYLKHADIEAETAEQAIAKAQEKFPGMNLNRNYVKTIEELEAEEIRKQAEWEAYKKAEVEKRENEKARKLAREKAKAEAMGMNLEEYRAEQNRQKKIRRIKKEIVELEEELNRKKAILAGWENQ